MEKSPDKKSTNENKKYISFPPQTTSIWTSDGKTNIPEWHISYNMRTRWQTSTFIGFRENSNCTMVKRSKIISLMKCWRGGVETSFVSELWGLCVLRGPWAWVWTGSMHVWKSQLWSMRMDLERRRGRRSYTATDAAEIDFMNIKQQRGRYWDRDATVNTGTHYGGFMHSAFYFWAG